MKKQIIASVLLVALPVSAFGETLHVTQPTVDVVGNPVTPAEIKSIQIYRNNSLFTTITPVPEGGTQDVTVTLQLGSNTMKARAVNLQNLAGPYSPDLLLAANTPTPLPTATPTNTPLPAIGAPGVSQ